MASLIDFVVKLRHLGSLLTSDLSAAPDADSRTKSASAAFAQLRHVARGSAVAPAARGAVCDAIITSTLLCGVEIRLTEIYAKN